jgi:hypothetical protein
MQNQNPAILKLRTTLQVGEALTNCRRSVGRLAAALTDGIPTAGITAQELVAVVGQGEANLILAANAVFTASPLPESGD